MNDFAHKSRIGTNPNVGGATNNGDGIVSDRKHHHTSDNDDDAEDEDEDDDDEDIDNDVDIDNDAIEDDDNDAATGVAGDATKRSVGILSGRHRSAVQPLRAANYYPNEVKFCDISDDDDDDDDHGDGNRDHDHDDDHDEDDDEFNDDMLGDYIGDRYDDTVSISTSTARNRRLLQATKHNDDDDNDDADSIMSSESKGRPKPEIPDGGYGWVVVFSSLVVSLIADGISFSFGLLYTEFLTYFGESKSKTAWIGSIFLAVPLLSGPVMSNLVDKYGCQRMTIIGGVLSGIGFMLAAMANSVVQLYWTFGVIGGLGLGIGYVTAVCSVVGWFDKRRTFATGIGASGTGIGTFLYAPLTQYLIEAYGWRGTCLILAGTLFNICVCGCLMLDPEWLIESNKLDAESRSQSMKTFSNSSVCLDEIKKLLEDGAPNETVLDTLVTSYNTEVNQQFSNAEQSKSLKKYSSLLLLPTYFTPEGDIDGEVVTGNLLGSRRSLRKKMLDADVPRLFTPSNHLTVNNNMMAPPPKLQKQPRIHRSDDSLPRSEKCTVYDDDAEICMRVVCDDNWDTKQQSQRRHRSMDGDDDGDLTLTSSPLLSASSEPNTTTAQLVPRNDFVITIVPSEQQAAATAAVTTVAVVGANAKDKPLYKSVLRQNASLKNANYLRNMRIHRNSIHYRGAMLSTHRYRLRTSSCPNIYRNSMTTLAQQDTETTWWMNVVEVLKSVFDFTLFLNPKFSYFQFSTVLLFTWFIVPYFYLPEHMLSKGYVEDDSAFVISLIGVSQTIGMISLGYIGDKPWLNVPKTYACCLAVCGFSVVLMPFVASNFILLCITGALFGLMFASSFSFTPIILVQLVSLDDFTVAYGLVLLIQGVGNLIGPPISGFMFEMFGVWDHAFYASGSFISLAGLFVYITALLQDRDARQASDDKGEDSVV